MAIKMASTILLLALLPLLVQMVSGADDNCDKGWIFHDYKCYIFRSEYVTFNVAAQTCEMFGGQVAYAFDQKSLDFLTAQVKPKSNYAWWYGIKIDTYNNKVITRDGQEMPKSFILPNTKQLAEPTTGCVAMRKNTNLYGVHYLLISTPCQVKLQYACRGDPKLVPKSVLNDKNHIVLAKTSDVYWFSDILDKRTHKDAQKACIEKSMTLISIRDESSYKNISYEMSLRQHDSIDPWWIGLSVNDGAYSWDSGVGVVPSVLQWKSSPSLYRYDSGCRVLLEEGTMDHGGCYSSKAPFICSRNVVDTGTFGCPPKWFRAGQSCYYYSKSITTTGTQTQAQDICAKFDSHLISIDTNEEKIWLLDSSFLKLNSYTSFWTSLNDKKTLNDFRWADGSKASKEIVQINMGYFTRGTGKCFTFNPSFKFLYRNRCEYYSYPGCQYKSQNGQCVSKYWKFFNGNCYYMVDYYGSGRDKIGSDRSPYALMLQKCYADVVQYDSSITVQPLKIESKDVMNFFSSKQFYTLWTGLTEKEKGVYQWADGSTADMSLFDKSSSRVNNSTERCVSINGAGRFMLRSCDSDLTPQTLCEKEVPYHHAG